MSNKLEPPAEWVNPYKIKKKSGKKCGIGILILSLVLLAGTSGYFLKSGKLSLLQNKDKSKEIQAETEQPDYQPPQDMQTAVSKEAEERIEESQKEEPFLEPEVIPESEHEDIQEEIPEPSDTLEFEQGEYALTEEEAYFMNVMASYGWIQIGEKKGEFEATQEELLTESMDYEIDSVASQVVHTQMLAEGLSCEGIILKRKGTANHSLYQNPYYFSVFLSYEGDVRCTYEEFANCIVDAVATSELADYYGTYVDDYAIDGNSTTAWAIGGEERTGESITLMLDEECIIYGVLILNGYWKSESTYKNNGIATAFDIYTGSDWQTYAYGYKGDYVSEAVNRQVYDTVGIFYDSVVADRVTINISGVENGEKYEDICVSEIMVLAR